MKSTWKTNPLWLACMLALATPASAETFSLGEVLVTAPSPDALSNTTTSC